MIAIIGGGAAGVLAAIGAEQNPTVLFEKNEKLMKKVYITGKGRCNVTFDGDVTDLVEHTVSNPYFLYAAGSLFGPDSMRRLLAENGVPTVVERGGRVFPVSQKSSDVMKGLERALRKTACTVHLNETVRAIVPGHDRESFHIVTDRKTYCAARVIVTTGGMSYPATGSTGDGYAWAKALGHDIVLPVAALSGLVTAEDTAAYEGVSLENVGIKVTVKGKEMYRDLGDMIFTAHGLSGPLILTASSRINRRLPAEISIDLKPALDKETLDRRMQRDFDKNRNKKIVHALEGLTVKKMIPIVLKQAQVDPNCPVNSLTREQRRRLGESFKNLKWTAVDTEPLRRAVVTAGGVSVEQVDPSTMASKICPGLYFAGEVLDLDAVTGGYNLQIAWSTGYLAGRAATGGLYE